MKITRMADPFLAAVTPERSGDWPHFKDFRLKVKHPVAIGARRPFMCSRNILGVNGPTGPEGAKPPAKDGRSPTVSLACGPGATGYRV